MATNESWPESLEKLGISPDDDFLIKSDVGVHQSGLDIACPEATSSGTTANPDAVYGIAMGANGNEVMWGGASNPSLTIPVWAIPEGLQQPSDTLGILEQYGQDEGYTQVAPNNAAGSPRWAVRWHGSRLGDPKYQVRHPNSSNFLMTDGHAETRTEDEFRLMAETAAGPPAVRNELKKEFTIKGD